MGTCLIVQHPVGSPQWVGPGEGIIGPFQERHVSYGDRTREDTSNLGIRAGRDRQRTQENNTGSGGVHPRGAPGHPGRAWERGWGRLTLRKPYFSPHKAPHTDSHAFPYLSTRGQAEAGEEVRWWPVGSRAGLIRPQYSQAHIQHTGLFVLLRQQGQASLPACCGLCDFICCGL